jgi:twitching motility protein PilT
MIMISMAGTLRGIISQRLLPHASGTGRVPAVEVMIVTNRIRDFILDPEQAPLIHDAIAEGEYYGMQTFDQSLLKLYEAGMISLSDAAQVAANPHDFKLLAQQRGHDVSLMQY